ncbi:hypothetical protein HN020_03170 [Brevibacillus borstelensis]|uniref:hypothetical protein n=1 Tax=Brevibacillus TaxID=55080 RepID=UPI00148F6EC9|nr:hypothetical protein [Brevibacillus borstelensis]MED1854799.1 hypothetical protein [Brevibacillus borstelensis]NOU53799.1 hypothetical protein [Brevibacillus borstelensis]
MISYKIEISDELKKDIERAIENEVGEISDGEQFSVIVGEKAILGKRSGDIVVIERIVEKIL